MSEQDFYSQLALQLGANLGNVGNSAIRGYESAQRQGRVNQQIELQKMLQELKARELQMKLDALPEEQKRAMLHANAAALNAQTDSQRLAEEIARRQGAPEDEKRKLLNEYLKSAGTQILNKDPSQIAALQSLDPQSMSDAAMMAAENRRKEEARLAGGKSYASANARANVNRKVAQEQARGALVAGGINPAEFEKRVTDAGGVLTPKNVAPMMSQNRSPVDKYLGTVFSQKQQLGGPSIEDQQLKSMELMSADPRVGNDPTWNAIKEKLRQKKMQQTKLNPWGE